MLFGVEQITIKRGGFMANAQKYCSAATGHMLAHTMTEKKTKMETT